jgi:hypothetical protein
MTGDPVVDLLLRHIAIIGFVVMATLLATVRRRAVSLIEAGTVTRDEVDRLFLTALGMCMLGAVVLWTLQEKIPDPACLLEFPPPGSAGAVYWSLLAALAAGFAAWLWLLDGADLLHRLAPALSPRGRLEHLSARALRARLSSVVVALPLLVIGLQRLLPGWLARC